MTLHRKYVLFIWKKKRKHCKTGKPDKNNSWMMKITLYPFSNCLLCSSLVRILIHNPNLICVFVLFTSIWFQLNDNVSIKLCLLASDEIWKDWLCLWQLHNWKFSFIASHLIFHLYHLFILITIILTVTPLHMFTKFFHLNTEK